MGAVADDQLDDRVDEVVARRGETEAVDDGDLGRSRRRRRACAGRWRSPSPSDQCSTTIGRSTTTPVGTWTNAPPARNASCRTVNASGDASEHEPSSVAHVGLGTRREPADRHALRFERRVELVVHDASVAHDDQAGALARLGRERTAAGRRLDARRAELVGPHRPVALEVELADAAVAPDLLGRARPLEPVEPGRGRGPPGRRASPARPNAARRVGSEVRRRRHTGCRAAGQPTAPSMLSSIRRDSSTAYSIGSVLVIGSMKPLTIIAVACCSVSPRLIR